jgi:hypothetical protein
MKIPILGWQIDERFLTHRRRSTSAAGVLGAFVALGLFTYRFYGDGVWSWDLFAVIGTFILVKLVLMTWYFLTD